MTKLIAIEDGLTPFIRLLQQHGYSLTDISNYRSADAVVLSGMDENIMNIESIATKVPVIVAEGKTPGEVLEELEARIR